MQPATNKAFPGNALEIYSETFGRVWTDVTKPVLFANIRYMPEMNLFRSFCEAYVSQLRKIAHRFGRVYGVTDLSNSRPLPIEALFLYYKNYLPQQFEVGLRYKAYVKPKNVFSQFSLEEVLKNADSKKLGVFATFEEAFEAINVKSFENKSAFYGQAILQR
jgi:hypothetical protein